MALQSTNPDYAANVIDWRLLRTAYKGERAMKERGTEYLPATSGMVLDGQGRGNYKAIGEMEYQAYKMRAVFPDHVAMAVEYFLGLLHKRQGQIELPERMKYLEDKATEQGDTLEQLMRKINEQQIVTGRVGILADFPKKQVLGEVEPRIAIYCAEHILNWDEGPVEQDAERQLKLVVLDESENTRMAGQFEWKLTTKYRVLMLNELAGEAATNTTRPDNVTPEEPTAPEYRAGLFVQDGPNQLDFNDANMEAPTIRGTPLDEIPFCFINTKDIAAAPDDPPLLGLARLVLSIYRNSADYEQALFMQGQETLVIVNGKGQLEGEVIRTGTGQVINVKVQGDAKYIGVSGAGLAEQREALENKYRMADEMAGKAIDTRSKDKESAAALGTRIAAQTASLNQIAKTGAAGLQKVLRQVAKWMGANPDEVKINPNLEFADGNISADDLTKLMTAKTAGLPLSEESLHALLKDNGFTALAYEDEVDRIDGEPPRGMLATLIDTGLAVPGDPNSAKAPKGPKKVPPAPAGGARGPLGSTRKPAPRSKA